MMVWFKQQQYYWCKWAFRVNEFMKYELWWKGKNVVEMEMEEIWVVLNIK